MGKKTRKFMSSFDSFTPNLKFTYESSFFLFFFQLVFTPCNAEQPLPGMELQGKEAQKG